MVKSKLFFGGIPVEPEVNLLRARFGVPVAGTEILHESIEDVIGVRHLSSRYRSVIHSWRASLLRQDNIELQAIPGIGFRVLTEEERVELHISDATKGIRRINKAGRDLSNVPRATLTEQARARADSAQSVLAKMSIALRDHQAALSPPDTAVASPRITLARVAHNA